MPKALNAHAQAVFEQLTRDLTLGAALKLDAAKGSYMAVHVEQLTERHYSVAHYHEQNGDQMADPEMTFYRCEHGKVFPCSYQQDSLGIYRMGLEITDLGIVEGENPKEQADQADFANIWMKNIAEQQRLTVSVPPEEAHDA